MDFFFFKYDKRKGGKISQAFAKVGERVKKFRRVFVSRVRKQRNPPQCALGVGARGGRKMIQLYDVFKPTISELNMPEINPGFNLNSSSDESSKGAKAGCALICESGARPAPQRTSNRRVS